MDEDWQPQIVAAIDFGTCNTRMAFTVKRHVKTKDKLEIIVMSDWKHAPDTKMAPTSVLIDHAHRVTAYGQEAEETFRTMSEENRRSCLLFKNFKMDLHQRENFSENHPIQAINGGSLKAIDLFSKALRYLADKLIKFIPETTGVEVCDPIDDIQWVLTVPAIWKPGARQFMRKSAMKAGICKASTRKRLIIALEPECAALYVRSWKDQHGATESVNYGVVDCGGGTVDIVYHSLEERDNDDNESTLVVSELIPPSGGPYGGTLVDAAFEKLLDPVFQGHKVPSFFQELKKSFTAAWLSLMKQLEEKKNVLDEKEIDDAVWFDLSLAFNSACVEITGRDALSLLKENRVEGIILSSTKHLEIQAELIKKLYCTSIDEICKCLKEDLKAGPAKKVGALYLVGTFANSRYLLESVQQQVHNLVPKERVINPPEGSLAIVKGAVMYGINPRMIQERVAAMSYGISILVEFDCTKHPKEKAEFHNGKKYCRDVYDEFVKPGQMICNTAEVIKSTHVPVEPDLKSICISIYSAPRTVRFVDDEGCKHMASIVVHMPILTGGTDRQVFVEIDFSGSEIHVVATDENTDKSYDTSLEFMCEK